MSSRVALQVGVLARRALLRSARQPATIVPSLLFPMFLLAVNSGGLEPATRIPGFPTDRYVDFALAFAFVQGALFATTNGGTDLARDVDTGFLNRLALTPVSAPALLVGQLAGVVALGLVQALFFLAVGLVAGVSIQAGFIGVLTILALAVTIGTAFAGVGAFLALRTGSGEAVQGLFPVLFIFLFLSSMALPRNLIQTDWFRTVATYNPVSYLIEAIRSLIISGWNAQAIALGFGLATAIAVVSLTAASLALTSRLERT
ncbi:MAG: ABC transporter permease [Thermoleophilia bacterium]|nr:ABC transporter permease [Thermoleophilia bacterium]